MKRTQGILTGALIGLGAVAACFGIYRKRLSEKKDLPPDTEPDSDKIRIACIGDSITYGSGVKYFGREKKVWTAVLNNLLGDTYQVINYGIGGATLQREGDKPYREFPHLGKAKEAAPSIYILMLGTNDSKPYNWDAQRYEAQLSEWIAELTQGEDDHKLILMTPPYACPAKGKKEVAYDISDQVIRDAIRPMVLRAADENGLQIIDLYAFTDGHGEWFTDGVHPNKTGNRKIAEAVYAKMTGIEVNG